MRFRKSPLGLETGQEPVARGRAPKLAQDLVAAVAGRSVADLMLLAVTAVELVILLRLTPSFTVVDWVYVSQHLVVLGIALTRPAPVAQDRSLRAAFAVAVSYAYPYALVICLHWTEGHVLWPGGGLVLVTVSAAISLAGLLSLGRFFGLRPALRGLATGGPYRLVRHPLYLAYILADLGYELHEWNLGTTLIILAGWASLLYRILAEERVLSQDPGWQGYAGSVRYRLIPGLW